MRIRGGPAAVFGDEGRSEPTKGGISLGRGGQ